MRATCSPSSGCPHRYSRKVSSHSSSSGQSLLRDSFAITNLPWTMNPEEFRRIEVLFQVTHGFSQQMSAARAMQLRVIARGPNPFNVVRQHYLDSRAGPNGETRHKSLGL